MSNSLQPHGLYSQRNSPDQDKVKVVQSCLTLCEPMNCSPWNSPGQNTGVGSLSLLQGIFPTQGSNLSLPHCGWILYQLSHKGNASNAWALGCQEFPLSIWPLPLSFLLVAFPVLHCFPQGPVTTSHPLSREDFVSHFRVKIIETSRQEFPQLPALHL